VRRLRRRARQAATLHDDANASTEAQRQRRGANANANANANASSANSNTITGSIRGDEQPATHRRTRQLTSTACNDWNISLSHPYLLLDDFSAQKQEE
jgi:hypothetical protein